MLQSDTLANEFNDILNAVEIFAPFQPLDPAITFYAPLRNNVRDLRLNQDLFERLSDAWYKDGNGIYRRAGINQPRFEEARLLMEPAGTNICENYNAEVDPGLSNITLGGTGTLERVEDSAALNAAGFGDIGNGYAVRIASGGGTANANIDGPATNDTHTLSVVIKKIGAQGFVNLRTSANDFSVQITNQEYQRIHITGLASAASVLQINTTSGGEAFFILNQMEQSPVVSSPIVTEGTAGQRAIDVLQYADLDNWFPQAAGMAVVTWSPRYSTAELISGIERSAGMVSTRLSTTSLLREVTRTTLVTQFQSIDSGFNNQAVDTGGLISGDDYTVAVRWNTAQNELQVGFSHNGGAWVWSPVGDYSGLFTSENFLALGALIDLPASTKDVFIYNEDRGQAWIEANHP